EVVYDDARHYILTTHDRYDVITSDPIHPWVKGAATLYTKEYFEMCKRHLNPGGLVTQWVPLYESNLETVKSEIATFFEVFPNGTVWSNDINGKGYDLVLLGQAEPMRIDIDRLQERLQREDHAGGGVRWYNMLALTHVPSPNMDQCQRTYVECAPIDYGRAVRQHEAYCDLLRRCGAEVHTLTVNRDLPDCVFIEDTAVVLDEVA